MNKWIRTGSSVICAVKVIPGNRWLIHAVFSVLFISAATFRLVVSLEEILTSHEYLSSFSLQFRSFHYIRRINTSHQVIVHGCWFYLSLPCVVPSVLRPLMNVCIWNCLHHITPIWLSLARLLVLFDMTFVLRQQNPLARIEATREWLRGISKWFVARFQLNQLVMANDG